MTTWMHSDHVSLFRMNHGTGFIPNLYGIYFFTVLRPQYQTQECIPVGCVPSAAVAVGGGVSAQGCVSAQGGVCIPACTG